MNSGKKIGEYVFLICFAFLTGYATLVRSSFYEEDGMPHIQKEQLRIVGENLAGDYGAARLLEQKLSPGEAYKSGKISDFLNNTLHTEKQFYSSICPVKAFLIVPFLELPYKGFLEVWQFWGLFWFGAALYTFLPLKKALLMMFALPAYFLAFSTGGWGTFAAAAVVFALTLSDDYPKTAGFAGALCLAEPICFLFVLGAFIIRRQKKAALFCSVAGTVLLLLTVTRYGFSAFTAAFLSAWNALKVSPCALSSLTSALSCSGMPLVLALLIQGGIVAAVIVYGIRLFRKTACPQAVQDAYLCAGLSLASPFTVLGDYGLLYAGIAFYFRDCSVRGRLKGDSLFLLTAFLSIYADAFFSIAAGASVHLILALALTGMVYRRSY